jgi:hypothetical protein
MSPMKLYMSYAPNPSCQWENICAIDLRPNPIPIPKHIKNYPIDPSSVIGLHEEEINIPNGEQLKVSVTYDPINRGISIYVMSKGKFLLQVGGFKRQESSHDPNVMFLTPGGECVSLIVGF